MTAIKSATRLKHTPLNNYISLNKPIYEDESEKTLIDLLAETIVSDPEQIVINDESFKHISDEIFKCLSKFEKSVLRLYRTEKLSRDFELLEERQIDRYDFKRIKRKLEASLEKRVTRLSRYVFCKLPKGLFNLYMAVQAKRVSLRQWAL